AAAAAEGNVLPALLGILGMALIGSASLWLSYRTTVRLYTGQFRSGRRPPVAVGAPAKTAPLKGLLLERRLPFMSEQASAVALGGFRSLMRAPEAKMLLLSPVLLLLVFGSMLFTRSLTPPLMLRPLMAFGATAMMLYCLVQLVGNQFGFDRS